MIYVFLVSLVLAFFGTLLSIVHYSVNYKNCYSVGQKIYNTFLLVCMLGQIVFVIFFGLVAVEVMGDALAGL